MSVSPAALNVLVIGYGLLGSCILDTFTSPRFSATLHTHLLVKRASLADPVKDVKIKRFADKGVSIIEGDVTDGPTALVPLLTSNAIHTVVNAAMTWPQSDVDTPVLEACKAAGCVRHLIPADYGYNSEAMDESTPMWSFHWHNKVKLHNALRQSGLDWTYFVVGGFAESLYNVDSYGVDLANRIIKAAVSFDTQVMLISVHDLAHMIAHVVLDPAARNKPIFGGQPYTYNHIAAALEQAIGRSVTRVVISEEETKRAVSNDYSDLQHAFLSIFAAGKGTLWPVEQTYGFPQFKYTTLEIVAKRVTKGDDRDLEDASAAAPTDQ